MANLGTNLRSFLLSQTELAAIVGLRIHQDHVPQSKVDTDGYFRPYIWFGRSGVGREECLSPELGAPPDIEFFDLECIAPSMPMADEIADQVTALDGYKGEFGEQSIQAIFVEDQSDEYVPRGQRTDVGSSVRALSLALHR